MATLYDQPASRTTAKASALPRLLEARLRLRRSAKTSAIATSLIGPLWFARALAAEPGPSIQSLLNLNFPPGCPAVRSVGDIVDGPGDPLACVARLRDAGADVVRGNHEGWVTAGTPLDPFDYPQEALDWFAALPVIREYETPTGRLLLGHSISDHDIVRELPDTEGHALAGLTPLWRLSRSRRYRWFVGGHTHVPAVHTVEGLTIINPGALIAEQAPGFMIGDFARGEIEQWAICPVARDAPRPPAPADTCDRLQLRLIDTHRP